MALVPDASAALAWLIDRKSPAEARRAEAILRSLYAEDGVVPGLWYAEVTNGILVAERQGACSRPEIAEFLGMLSALPIAEDRARPSDTQPAVLSLARVYRLSGYDAVYLELALRSGAPLATFDRHLAEAVRKAGGRVFGDRA